MQKSIFYQKIQKVCALQRKHEQFQMQLFENYNDSEHAVKTIGLGFRFRFRLKTYALGLGLGLLQ